jgi:hypothetical protein
MGCTSSSEGVYEGSNVGYDGNMQRVDQVTGELVDRDLEGRPESDFFNAEAPEESGEVK